MSFAQESEFQWVCEAWDAAGIEGFGDACPETLSTWIQNVLEDHENAGAIAFSSFGHAETKRRLAGAKALALPAV